MNGPGSGGGSNAVGVGCAGMEMTSPWVRRRRWPSTRGAALWAEGDGGGRADYHREAVARLEMIEDGVTGFLGDGDEELARDERGRLEIAYAALALVVLLAVAWWRPSFRPRTTAEAVP